MSSGTGRRERLTQPVMSSGTGRRGALACGVETSHEEYEGGVLLGGASSAVGTVRGGECGFRISDCGTRDAVCLRRSSASRGGVDWGPGGRSRRCGVG
jgi:hypothetical protein